MDVSRFHSTEDDSSPSKPSSSFQVRFGLAAGTSPFRPHCTLKPHSIESKPHAMLNRGVKMPTLATTIFMPFLDSA
ncbi:hypothetical protein ABKN59_011859 [Abortiporus biennis]